MTTKLPAAKPRSTEPKQLLAGPDCARPINVCFLIDELRTGGTETQLLRLISRFDRTRVRPHLCLLDGTSLGSRRLEPSDCEIMRLGVRKLLSPYCFKQARKFRQALKDWKIDLLQAHFPDSTYFGVPIAKWAGVSRIVRTRRDLFYWVTHRHLRWGRHLDQFYNRLLIDAMIVNSEAVKAAAIRDERLAPKRIMVIPNGLDLSLFSSRDRPFSTGQELRIGILAMLRPEKRVDLFIEAARQVANAAPNARFLIGGDGPERAYLQDLVDGKQLRDRVDFLGSVDDVPNLLKQLDIAVLCSDTEGLSNAIIEYMAAGLPIVATAVGGNLELLHHGDTALLTPPGDSGALAKGILQLIERPLERQRLSMSARRAVQNQFDLSIVTKQYESFYADLCMS